MPTQTKDRPGLSWEAICEDPILRDLPYKVETNQYGQLVLSPHRRRHSRMQVAISDHLRDHAPSGIRYVELAIQTSDGVKVADVAWMSKTREASVPEGTEPAPIAPEICVEVRSPGNSDEEMDHKRALYLEAGADEVWICDTEGHLRFYDANGERETSARVPHFPSEITL